MIKPHFLANTAAVFLWPAESGPLLIGLAAVAVLVALFLAWQLFGRGPRLTRGHRRALNLARQGQWEPALGLIQQLQLYHRLSKLWQGRLCNAEGECLRIAGVQAVQVREFEKGLEHHLQAAELLGLNAAEVKASVLEKMLGEVRALFAGGNGSDTGAIHAMIGRVQKLNDPWLSPEALFWQGLCQIREGQWELAQKSLEAARTDAEGSQAQCTTEKTTPQVVSFIDPPLYLGGIMMRHGQAKEGLRFITEANRAAGNCPWISLQLGIAIVAAGGDGYLALRALQRALGPQGLPLWLKEPDRAWIDGLPEDRSWVRKLAVKHAFVCPLWGNDVGLLMRRGQLALGEAHYRLGDYPAAAKVFQQLLDENAPTHDALRWLGLTLTRQEQYQEAFKHLKTALDLEEPKDRMTAGCLALCAARGKPDRPEDQGPNVAWAIRSVRQFTAFGDREWVSLLMQVYGEALQLNMALAGEDLVFLCDHLLSVQATDPVAALAFHQLAAEHPALLKPPHAWLYCRAAMQHDLDHAQGLDLFALTFQTAADARSYFAAQQWDFEELEYTFLKQAAGKAPGAFPAALGADYPPLGTAMLLERSERLEKEGKADAALTSAEVLLDLVPGNAKAHDRLARLWHRRGQLDRAAKLLSSWCALEPDNPLPWTRLGIVQYQQGQAEQGGDSLGHAIQLNGGSARADVCCLAARLLLSNAICKSVQNGNGACPHDTAVLRAALAQAAVHLQQALQDHPDHEEAQWLTAAVFALLGDRAALASRAAAFDAKESSNSRFHYFAAISHLAADRFAAARAAAERAAAEPDLKSEAVYLAGWASLHLRDTAGAIAAFKAVAHDKQSPSAATAQAMLGVIHFRQEATEEAVHCWQALDHSQCTAWQLTEPLQRSFYLAGLQALQRQHYEKAVERFREAGKAGLRERSLGELIRFALVKEGQALALQEFGNNAAPRAKNDESRREAVARLLEQALQVGPDDGTVAYMLAMARKQQGKLADARTALRKIAGPDANVVLQMGLLSFKENQFAQAEEEFGRAWQLDPTFYAAGYNLMLARLCQGKINDCVPLVGQLKSLASSQEGRQLLSLLEPLLEQSQNRPDGKPQSLPGTFSNNAPMHNALAAMAPADEQRLLEVVLGLGQMEAVFPLLRGLAQARPDSQGAQQAFATGVLLQAKLVAERCHWDKAEKLLAPLAASFTTGSPASRRVAQDMQMAVYNLLGCCQCLQQEFDRAIECFSWAIKLAPNDPWLYQNLALAWELKGQLDQADGHWNRYFDLQSRVPAPPTANYRDHLAYEGLNRLAEAFSKKERWNTALTYLQRACRLRPGDFETLERLFHMYNQVKRPEDARRTLKRLRELRPSDPQLELYELDLHEVKTLEDFDRMLADIRKTLSKYPNDLRVEEKAVSLVSNVIPLIRKMFDQYVDQLSRVVEQVRRLPNYQINWSAVHDVMRDLQRELQKLRRIANKCLSLVTSEEHRRIIRELTEHIDRKIEVCQQMGA